MQQRQSQHLQALAEVTSRWAVPADASDLSVALPKVARRTGSFAGEVGRQERGVPAIPMVMAAPIKYIILNTLSSSVAATAWKKAHGYSFLTE